MNEVKKLAGFNISKNDMDEEMIGKYWDNSFYNDCLSLYKNSGIDPYFFDKSFAAVSETYPKQREYIETGKKFVARVISGTPSILIMCGKSGTGKTLLSSCCLREILFSNKPNRFEGIQEHYSGLYVLSEQIKNRYDAAKSFTSKESEAGITAYYSSRDILVIDEIGQNAREQEKETFPLFRVLNALVYSGRSAILISNMSHDAFCKLLGPATVSRLSTSAVFLDFDGIPDFRVSSRDEWGVK